MSFQSSASGGSSRFLSPAVGSISQAKTIARTAQSISSPRSFPFVFFIDQFYIAARKNNQGGSSQWGRFEQEK